VGLGSYSAKSVTVDDVEINYNRTMMFNMYGTGKNVYYQFRPAFMLDSAPIFRMSDRESESTASAIVSLPIFTLLSELSIDNMLFEKLIIKLKDPSNIKDIDTVKNAITTTLVGNSFSEMDVKDTTGDRKT
jgi:hypothetical protein